MVILAGWEGQGETATFKAYINHLVNWLWIGGFVFIIGTIVAAWPNPKKSSQAVISKSKIWEAVAPAK